MDDIKALTLREYDKVNNKFVTLHPETDMSQVVGVKTYLNDFLETSEYAQKKDLTTKQDTLTFDAVPTENSQNPVTSDGIKKYIDSKLASLVNGDEISF